MGYKHYFSMRFIPQASYTSDANFIRFRLEDTTTNYCVNAKPGNVSADATLPKIASVEFAHSMDIGTLHRE